MPRLIDSIGAAFAETDDEDHGMQRPRLRRETMAGSGYRLAAAGLGRRPPPLSGGPIREAPGDGVEDAVVRGIARAWTGAGAAARLIVPAAGHAGAAAAAHIQLIPAAVVAQASVVCALTAIGATTLMYWEKGRTARLDRDIGRVVQATQIQQARTAGLRTEWSALNEPGRLADMAARHLALQPIAPPQFAAAQALPERLQEAASAGPAVKVADADPTPPERDSQPDAAPTTGNAAAAPAPAPRPEAVPAAEAAPAVAPEPPVTVAHRLRVQTATAVTRLADAEAPEDAAPIERAAAKVESRAVPVVGPPVRARVRTVLAVAHPALPAHGAPPARGGREVRLAWAAPLTATSMHVAPAAHPARAVPNRYDMPHWLSQPAARPHVLVMSEQPHSLVAPSSPPAAHRGQDVLAGAEEGDTDLSVPAPRPAEPPPPVSRPRTDRFAMAYGRPAWRPAYPQYPYGGYGYGGPYGPPPGGPYGGNPYGGQAYGGGYTPPQGGVVYQ